MVKNVPEVLGNPVSSVFMGGHLILGVIFFQLHKLRDFCKYRKHNERFNIFWVSLTIEGVPLLLYVTFGHFGGSFWLPYTKL